MSFVYAEKKTIINQEILTIHCDTKIGHLDGAKAAFGNEELDLNGDLGIPVPDYVDTNVSDKVVRIIQSYVGVVNKMVWRKA